MKAEPFVHLHLHSAFSILDGACQMDDLLDAVAEQNMPAVALTDHGVLYGAIDFYKKAQSRGVKPIIGCEAYITTGSRHDRKTEGGKAPNHHLVLLASNETGYYNLMRLISLAHIEGYYYKPRIDRDILQQYHEGLIGLSACLKGEIATALVSDNVAAATTIAGTYSDIFGPGNFFLEVHNHGIAEQRRANSHMADLARRTGLPIVATNDVHYLKKDHAPAHEVLLAMQTQCVMSDPKRMRYQTQEFYLKTRREMEELFKDFPGAVDRTLDVAERCNLEIEFGKIHFPTYKVPHGVTALEHLTAMGHEGLRRLYGIRDPRSPADDREKQIVDRFNMEMDIIQRTGFVNYFLVVWDFVSFARRSGIPVGPGRGSGGGSLVAYTLGITAIDPLRYGLIFERFLNPERVSPPDFDIDFCQDRRGEVIEYVKEKYGRENVAQIITFGSLGAKTVIRDVGRVLEISYADCDRLSKMVPDDPKITLEKALEVSPDFKQAYQTEENCKRILDYGFVLEGLYRNPGMHAAGVVIGERPLIEIIPLTRGKDEEIITQYTMEPLGELGLLKMDFLGLKTLTVIKETVDLVQKYRGVTLDIDNLPLDDKPTYELLNRGDTVGVFQVESDGMRNLIRRIGINGIEDLIAMIALFRPGPMTMLDDYVNRKTGKAKITYPHPLLEPVLKETYGVMLYQEQVQKAANVLAGYSLGQADILRRAMGKKKKEVMDQQRAGFIEGCAKTHKIKPELAGKIFDTIAQFAGYGFNKSHSAAYGLIAYQTAYLKANYPVEFMCALISSEIGNFDKLPGFVIEAGEMSLKVLPPDVNTSGVRFLPEGAAIRFGLAGIKNVGAGAAESIVAARVKEGPFFGLTDFAARVDGQLCNKKTLESLIRCGAFDAVDRNRARLFNAIDFAMSRAAHQAADRRSGQGSLFDLLGAADTSVKIEEKLPDAEPWHESTQLAAERELLGVYLSGHPLTQFSRLLDTYALAKIPALEHMNEKTVTRVGGIAASVAKRLTKKDTPPRPWATIQLEDLEGSIEVLVFPETYAEFASIIATDAPLIVCGEVQKRDATKLVAQELYPLADAPKQFCRRLGIHVAVSTLTEEKLVLVRDLLKLHPGPTPVTICLQYPKGEKVFIEAGSDLKVNPAEPLVRELEKLLGERGVFVSVDPKPCRRPPPSRGPRNGRNGGGRE